MKKGTRDLLKVGSSMGLLAGGAGLASVVINLLGKIWQKYELTEEFCENHPWLAAGRFVIRIFITLLAMVLIMMAPVYLFADKICNFIDKKYKESNKEDDFE